MLGRTQGSENLGTCLQAVPRQLCVLANNRTFLSAAKKYSSRSLFASQKLCCMPSMAKGEQLNRCPVAKKIDYLWASAIHPHLHRMSAMGIAQLHFCL